MKAESDLALDTCRHSDQLLPGWKQYEDFADAWLPHAQKGAKQHSTGSQDQEINSVLLHQQTEQQISAPPAAAAQPTQQTGYLSAAFEQPVSAPTKRAWIEAAKGGHLPQLCRLVTQHPSLINMQSGGLQCTATHWAAAHGHCQVLQQLLRWGADPLSLTCTGCTPLHSAAAAGKQDCVELLLQLPVVRQSLQCSNDEGQTAADLALQHKQVAVRAALLRASGPSGSNGEQAPVAKHSSSQQQQQPLPGLRSGFLLTSEAQNPSNAKSGCAAGKQGAVAEHTHSMTADAETATEELAPAALSGSSAQGSQPGTHRSWSAPNSSAQTYDDQQSAADLAAIENHANILSLNGVDAGSGKESPIAIDRARGRAWLNAARAGDMSMLQSLYAVSPDLLHYCGQGTSYGLIGNSALHWAAAKGHSNCVLWLLHQNIDAQHLLNQADATALHTAAEHGQAACAEVLVVTGKCDVQLLDGLAQSAVQAAASCGHRELANQLLQWDVFANSGATRRL